MNAEEQASQEHSHSDATECPVGITPTLIIFECTITLRGTGKIDNQRPVDRLAHIEALT